MSKQSSERLLEQTKKMIADIKATHAGLRGAPYSRQIMNNIRFLSGHFTNQDLAKNLAISTSTIHKAKVTGKSKQNHKSKTSKTVRFVETLPTSNFSLANLSQNNGKMILEFKTKSGMTISIFE